MCNLKKVDSKPSLVSTDRSTPVPSEVSETTSNSTVDNSPQNIPLPGPGDIEEVTSFYDIGSKSNPNTLSSRRQIEPCLIVYGDDDVKKQPKRRRKPQKPGYTAKGDERHFVKHEYHDHSQEKEDSATDDKRLTKGRKGTPFPRKLHNMLTQIEVDGLSQVISWLPHGRAFGVHKPKTFVSYVMPKYFRQTKLTSFQRQLNLYGFARLTQGRDNGSYYHELFLRGMPFLASRIVRIKIKGTGYKAASSPDQEPDFYSMIPVGQFTDVRSESLQESQDINEEETTEAEEHDQKVPSIQPSNMLCDLKQPASIDSSDKIINTPHTTTEIMREFFIILKNSSRAGSNPLLPCETQSQYVNRCQNTTQASGRIREPGVNRVTPDLPPINRPPTMVLSSSKSRNLESEEKKSSRNGSEIGDNSSQDELANFVEHWISEQNSNNYQRNNSMADVTKKFHRRDSDGLESKKFHRRDSDGLQSNNDDEALDKMLDHLFTTL